MSSTFHGLEVARRALNTQQSALHTTGNNIANASTPGYSRQRVNMTQTSALSIGGMNQSITAGQIGTGVQAGSIQRIRESFLDDQFRNETTKLGYWDAKRTSLSQMEDVLNEPSSNGLSAVMGEFWQSLQDLSANPENTGARGVVLERGQSVADTFHYLSDSLTKIQQDIGKEISLGVQGVNSLLEQISQLNSQIKSVEPRGYLPNDLYDKRDALVDELSLMMDVKVTKTPAGGNSSSQAEGIYTISMLGGDGKEYALVNGDRFNKLGFAGPDEKLSVNTPTPITSIQFFNSSGSPLTTSVPIANESGKVTFSQGKLLGMIESYGYSYTNSGGNEVNKGMYPDMLNDLDKLAFTFASVFNEVHEKGYDLNGESGKPVFILNGSTSQGAAKAIRLADLDTQDIAVSMTVTQNGTVHAGNGQNALNLANIPSMLLSNGVISLQGTADTIDLSSYGLGQNGSLNSFYEGMIGRLGVNAMQANRMTQNSLLLSQSVDEKRMSVSAVSLDEEMTNMMQFQHAYNAAARNITMVDEMLDRIINGMGLVGR
ncbi:flagellar hook-associated protein FlgK [Jeotgalibacillus proteolyticus]|uniref:Flagellar hook-associated protein 1 n=1 Tax=Jeotgalibacillus proteolyticus TaxID=2082395 RepID=A0A2S5GBF3_9BACL|nr:flagellar hook-associated protein FlgK [Jeotgalibacillus proteolyticus]PPA70245.1 flagellar hook-associated protein FlgK [Jeotgalibacillus proteolyticus]